MKLNSIYKLPKDENVQKHLSVYICIYLLSLSSMAHADQLDTFNFSASTTKMYDNNLFRRPTGEISDQATFNRLGITFDKAISLQKFHADFHITDNKYDKSDFLDFTAKNYNLAWNWAVTPSITGVLSTEREQRLNDFRFVQAQIQNIRTIKRHHFELEYAPYQTLFVILGYTIVDAQNSAPFRIDTQEEVSNKTNSAEYGVKYLFPSKAEIKFMYFNKFGGQLNGEPNFISQVDRKTDTDVYDLSFKSSPSLKLTFQANLSYIDRTYPTFSIRDYSGYYGGVSANYEWTSKLSLNAKASRGLSSFVRPGSSYMQSDTFSLGAKYYVSEKVILNLGTSYINRQFLGDGPVETDKRQDDETSVSASLSWIPREFISTNLSLIKSRRNSTDNQFDFNDSVAYLSLNLLF